MQRAKALTEDLLVVVREEHAKVKAILAQQQMEELESKGQDDVTLREIQKILYSTEVGA